MTQPIAGAVVSSPGAIVAGWRPSWWLALCAGAVLLVSAPAVMLLVQGLSHADGTTGFQFAGLLHTFADPTALRGLGQSVVLGLVVGSVTAIAGYPVAWLIARRGGVLGTVFSVLILVPMTVGSNLLAVGWLILLGREGVINSLAAQLGLLSAPVDLLFSWTSVVVAISHDALAFMVLPIVAVLKRQDRRLEDAARSLGASWFRCFLTVTLPLSAPGIAAGFLIVFMMSAGSIVLPLVLGGPGLSTMPMLIYQQITVAYDPVTAARLAIMLAAVAVAILYIQLRYLGRT